MGITGKAGAQEPRITEHMESARHHVGAHRQEASNSGEGKKRIERLTAEAASTKRRDHTRMQWQNNRTVVRTDRRRGHPVWRPFWPPFTL